MQEEGEEWLNWSTVELPYKKKKKKGPFLHNLVTHRTERKKALLHDLENLLLKKKERAGLCQNLLLSKVP